ncbi:right-handed parallel beta-helix repeat-containing protein [Paenibacillus rubinfantis]|uniref:right-handed parallel beta-helix repeat-containing protein n=1 Tax=Paenibacillus rubinfantis TaxID=1720296 RepID=UPI000A6CF017|nr:right-handed parallel beta-helix repeat-containing protein [Paenibacillus rubinfantis]
MLSEDRAIVISLGDFGASPDTDEDAQPAMRMALEAAARAEGPVVLEVPYGRYHFYPQSAIRAPYPVTNTASEEELTNVTKTIGLLLKGQRRLTLRGNGALFLFHGKQTMLVLDGCQDVAIHDLHFDYAVPTVTEMTVERCEQGEGWIEAAVHPDSRYDIQEGRLEWVGEDWRFREGPMQLYDPAENTTWRVDNWLEQGGTRTEEIQPGRLKFSFTGGVPEGLIPGRIVQMRDGIRDQVGVLISESAGIMFSGCGLHFMHGLGMVGQFSENLVFERLDLSPRAESGRTVAGFADFIHLSGCRGQMQIRDCRFAGAHDDAINVHGTYLRIVGRPSRSQMVVRFMHPQTYGLPAFRAGDAVGFVDANTLVTYETGLVVDVRRLSSRELLLTLERPAPEQIGPQDVLENITWSPAVDITGNHFARIPTRGVLASTRGRTVIRDNVFERMRMSAILVAADANSWYESGAVTEMVIEGNRFIACGGEAHAVIAIAPENQEALSDAPVHHGITIVNNRFEREHGRLLSARSTMGLVFRGNEILQTPSGELDPEQLVQLEACSDVVIEDPIFRVEDAQANEK